MTSQEFYESVLFTEDGAFDRVLTPAQREAADAATVNADDTVVEEDEEFFSARWYDVWVSSYEAVLSELFDEE